MEGGVRSLKKLRCADELSQKLLALGRIQRGKTSVMED